jgi:hypothetical protein
MSASTFTVTNRNAIRESIIPITRRVAEQLLSMAIASTPVKTGTLRGGWRMTPGRAPGAFIIENAVPYGRYIEFGTVDVSARHMMGLAAMAIRAQYAVR